MKRSKGKEIGGNCTFVWNSKVERDVGTRGVSCLLRCENNQHKVEKKKLIMNSRKKKRSLSCAQGESWKLVRKVCCLDLKRLRRRRERKRQDRWENRPGNRMSWGESQPHKGTDVVTGKTSESLGKVRGKANQSFVNGMKRGGVHVIIH